MKGLPRYPKLYTREQVTTLIIDRDTEIEELRRKLKDAESFIRSAQALATQGIEALNSGIGGAERLRTVLRDIASGGRR